MYAGIYCAFVQVCPLLFICEFSTINKDKFAETRAHPECLTSIGNQDRLAHINSRSFQYKGVTD